jgi:hypothetical protein
MLSLYLLILSPLEACPWGEHKIELSVIDTPKMSTALSEISPPKSQHWSSQLDHDDELLGNPENHRGDEKVRLLQKSLRDKLFECRDAGSFWRL